MREHTHLPAMMSFVRKHVAQHFQPHRPWWSPAISAEHSDPASAFAERFIEHLRAAGGALGQPSAGFLRSATRAVKLCWNLQMRSSKPDPLTANIVHVREDRRNSTDRSRRFCTPGSRVEMFDKNLVQAIVSGKDLACGLAGSSLLLTPRHALYCF